MIDLARGERFCVVAETRDEVERLHLGSCRVDGPFLVLHEDLDIDCCYGMVFVVQISSVTRIEVYSDREALDREIVDGNIGKTDGKLKTIQGPEVR